MKGNMSGRPPLPPFTLETAIQKVRAAEDAWNNRDPTKVPLAYTEVAKRLHLVTLGKEEKSAFAPTTHIEFLYSIEHIDVPYERERIVYTAKTQFVVFGVRFLHSWADFSSPGNIIRVMAHT